MLSLEQKLLVVECAALELGLNATTCSSWIRKSIFFEAQVTLGLQKVGWFSSHMLYFATCESSENHSFCFASYDLSCWCALNPKQNTKKTSLFYLFATLFASLFAILLPIRLIMHLLLQTI